MTIPASAPFAAAPYGAVPVAIHSGQQGGAVTPIAPLSTAVANPAARTADFATGDVVNPCFKGIYIGFVVTVNPGGAQTLSLVVEGKDDINSTYYRIAVVPASAAPGGVYLLYPGAPAGPVGDVLLGFNMVLPQSWRIRVIHSAAGAWTYSINVTQLP